jgi:putative hydrolase of the HAD superfamily
LWDLYRKDQILQKDLRRERFQKALADFGIDDAILADKIGSDYVEFCPKKNKLFPFSIEVLEYLSSKYHLHIITNGFHKTQHIKLKHSNLRKYFKEVVTSEQIGAKKPNPKIFEYALSMAKAKAEESIYIGDDLVVDILGSQNCNIDGVYFNPDKIKHQENPKFEISCLSQLMEIF